MFSPKQGSFKPILSCLFFIVIWSSGWVGSKYGQGFAGPITLLAYRYAVVVFVLVAIVSLTRSWRRVSPMQLVCHGCIGILSHAVYCGTANSAMTLGVTAGMVAFITAITPMLTAVISPAFAGERATHRQWIGLTMGFSAVLLVISDKIVLGNGSVAYTLPFIAILALSIATVTDRRISLSHQARNSELIPLPLVCLIHCSSALLVLVPAAGIFENYQIQWGLEVGFSILWLALVVSLFGYGLMFYLLRHLSATQVTSLEYLAPPTTMLMAFYIFGESLSLIDMIGLLLAACAVWLILSESAKKQFLSRDSSKPATNPTNHSIEPLFEGLGISRQAATVTAANSLYRHSRKYKLKINRFDRRREPQHDNLVIGQKARKLRSHSKRNRLPSSG